MRILKVEEVDGRTVIYGAALTDAAERLAGWYQLCPVTWRSASRIAEAALDAAKLQGEVVLVSDQLIAISPDGVTEALYGPQRMFDISVEEQVFEVTLIRSA